MREYVKNDNVRTDVLDVLQVKAGALNIPVAVKNQRAVGKRPQHFAGETFGEAVVALIGRAPGTRQTGKGNKQ